MPFLEDDEWVQIAPYLPQMIEEIKRYRQAHNTDLSTAIEKAPLRARRLFEEMTGCAAIHPNGIYHHRLRDWGPPCSQCGHLLRTPLARACVHCGQLRESEAKNTGRP